MKTPCAPRSFHFCLLLTTIACVTPLKAFAQIRTDGTLGLAPQTLVGPSYLIPESLGKMSGSNLFHSFQHFSINSGESANFTIASGGVNNVISRVTGGESSIINGPLSLTASSGSPSFYFINPAGVTFGANASIDVPGAFHVTTANYLKFPDGNFHADPKSGSTFSSAEPAAFGFLGTTRETIAVRNALLYNKAGDLGLVGGDLEIDQAGIRTDQGAIRLVANGATVAEHAVSGALPVVGGRLILSNASSVFSIAGDLAAGGRIDLAAGEAKIFSGAGISTGTATSMPAGAVTGVFESLEIDGRPASGSTGISSFAAITDTGKGGDVSVSARGSIQVLGGGIISSDTYGAGPGGSLTVKADSLLLDGNAHPNAARLTNRAVHGNAGTMSVSVADSIELVNASQISSDSFGAGQAGTINLQAGNDIRVLADSFVASNAYESGNAGAIRIAARNLTVDGTGGQRLTQITSQALFESQGNAGLIAINASGALNLINGGKIITDTNSIGRAGDIHVTAGSLLLDSRNYPGLTGIYSSNDFASKGDSGAVNIKVLGHAQILQSAQVSTSTWGLGNAGGVVFEANSLDIDGRGVGRAGIYSEVRESSAGQGGSVAVNAGPISLTVSGDTLITNSGAIRSDTGSSGHGGELALAFGGNVRLEEGGLITSLTSGTGRAGNIGLQVGGDTLITHGGAIRSDTGSSGHGGELALAFGGNVRLEEGGLITSLTSGTGRAGNIGLQVGGSLNIARQSDTLGAVISNLSFSDGHAGNMRLQVAGDLKIGVGGFISSGAFSKGNAGNIDIQAKRISLAGGDLQHLAWIANDSRGAGAAGAIDIRAEQSINLAEAGFISSDSYASGQGGKVSVTAPEIHIGGSGLVLGAAISSDAFGEGNAGRVEVGARNLIIEGGRSVFSTGINSRSNPQSSGNAGSVSVASTESLRVLNGGEITSSTAGSGAGGEVTIKAGSVDVSGNGSQIAAMAMVGSGGQPGSVTVNTDRVLRLSDGGSLSIANEGANGRPSEVLTSLLKVSSADLVLDDASIQANSTGNLPAGGLDISIGNSLALNRSKITTSANAGNGGPINLRAGQTINLDRSQITTSVSGLAGNGGDIGVKSQALVMNSGFIQANTAANDASGGNVRIDVKTLLPSGNSLFLGGQTSFQFQPGIFGFNVIQAAAPTGLSGTVTISSPILDISASLADLVTQMLDTGELWRSPCQLGVGSSLALTGRGGLAPSGRDMLSPWPLRRSGINEASPNNLNISSKPVPGKCTQG